MDCLLPFGRLPANGLWPSAYFQTASPNLRPAHLEQALLGSTQEAACVQNHGDDHNGSDDP